MYSIYKTHIINVKKCILKMKAVKYYKYKSEPS